VLCAGDLFITDRALAGAARAELGADTEVTTYQADWPDTPFGPVDGVREAAGDPDALAALAGDATAILTHLAPITARVIEAAPRLRAIGVTRGGPVNVDLAAATAHGVPVLYLPGRNLDAVAEFTIGAMITLCRSIAAAAPEMAAGTWDARYFRHELTGPELRACTVGLVGLGAVGARVAQLLRAFGTRVLAHDPYASEDAAQAVDAELVSLPELLASSDIVSVHTRLTDETRRMFDAAAFAAMKTGARFVNTARGELVDRAALLAALESGHLAGAALDVFDPEPPAAGDPLVARRDVIATPHIAGASRQVAADSVRRVSAAVARFLATGAVDHCANPGWTDPGRTRRGAGAPA
jgi:D-3-phosphoglycerate dehydrogenase